MAAGTGLARWEGPGATRRRLDGTACCPPTPAKRLDRAPRKPPEPSRRVELVEGRQAHVHVVVAERQVQRSGSRIGRQRTIDGQGSCIQSLPEHYSRPRSEERRVGKECR